MSALQGRELHSFKSISMIAVRSDARYETLPQLIDFARKTPGRINYFTVGQGSALHLLMELLQKEANLTMTHIDPDAEVDEAIRRP